MLQKYNAPYASDFNVCAKQVTFVPETTKSEVETEKCKIKNENAQRMSLFFAHLRNDCAFCVLRWGLQVRESALTKP